jgi:hypothetical protein
LNYLNLLFLSTLLEQENVSGRKTNMALIISICILVGFGACYLYIYG